MLQSAILLKSGRRSWYETSGKKQSRDPFDKRRRGFAGRGSKVVKYENSFTESVYASGIRRRNLRCGSIFQCFHKMDASDSQENERCLSGVKVRQHHGNYKEIEYWLEKEKVDVAF